MNEYTIAGGDKGATRLEVLSKTTRTSTKRFLESAHLHKRMNCLDLGCGNGEVALMLANYFGIQGRIVGLDIDEKNIELATKSAEQLKLNNLVFERKDVYQLIPEPNYDLIYSRFLFSHLKDPKTLLQNTWKSLKPGAKLLIEDTDFSGHFSNPKSIYFDQYVSLYQNLLHKRGANADIGPNLVRLLADGGFVDIEFEISHLAHTKGTGKLMAEITFEAISKSLISEGLITQEEFQKIHSEIVKFRKQKNTMMSLPRIFQIRAKRPL